MYYLFLMYALMEIKYYLPTYLLTYLPIVMIAAQEVSFLTLAVWMIGDIF